MIKTKLFGDKVVVEDYELDDTIRYASMEDFRMENRTLLRKVAESKGDWERTPTHKYRYRHKPKLRRKCRNWDGKSWWEYADPQVLARENLEKEFGGANTGRPATAGSGEGDDAPHVIPSSLARQQNRLLERALHAIDTAFIRSIGGLGPCEGSQGGSGEPAKSEEGCTCQARHRRGYCTT